VLIGRINVERSWTAGHDTMANGADAEKEKMRRFRDCRADGPIYSIFEVS
jgi:hypothetical protein